MKDISYRTVIADGWRLVKEHKMLWAFGLIALFLGQMGLLEVVTKVGTAGSSYAYFPLQLAIPEWFPIDLSIVSQYGYVELVILFSILAVYLLGAGLLYIASAIAQGALVHASAQIEDGNQNPSFLKAWHAGALHVWRVLALHLIKKIVILFLAVAVTAATVNALLDGSFGDGLLFIFLFIPAVIVGIVVSFLAVYATGYVVVEEYSFLDAISAAWRLFISHWLVSLEVGFVLLGVNALVSAGALLLFSLIFAPTAFLWYFILPFFPPTTSFFLTLYILNVVTALIGAILTAFVTVTWTHLFMRMHRHGVRSRVAQIKRRA